jgi:hypothetical protein
MLLIYFAYVFVRPGCSRWIIGWKYRTATRRQLVQCCGFRLVSYIYGLLPQITDCRTLSTQARIFSYCEIPHWSTGIDYFATMPPSSNISVPHLTKARDKSNKPKSSSTLGRLETISAILAQLDKVAGKTQVPGFGLAVTTAKSIVDILRVSQC